MPTTFTGHAASPTPAPQSSDMEVPPRTKRPPDNANTQASICPTDDEAVTMKGANIPQMVNKQSLDYILRSGLAGGLAGCAVSTRLWIWFEGID